MKLLTPYRPFEHFVFRTPLFPFEYLNSKEDELMNNSAFEEALLIASPELSEEVSKIQNVPGMPQKEKERIISSLYRYFQRACTRPTPFGLFAGCSIGSVGERTEIQLSERQKYNRTTRLDMNYICALTQQIERDRSIRELLRYYPNNSLYSVGGHIRYVEYQYLKTRRMHKITQVVNTEYIQKVLDLAKEGKHFSELAAALTDEETTLEETSDFIHNLIDVQLLVSELEPSITHPQPLISLINKIKELSNTDRQIVDILTEIDAQLDSIDSQPVGESVKIYPTIIKSIEKTKVSVEIKYLFQTDMFKPTKQATVSKQLIQDIQQVLIFFKRQRHGSSHDRHRSIVLYYHERLRRR